MTTADRLKDQSVSSADECDSTGDWRERDRGWKRGLSEQNPNTAQMQRFLAIAEAVEISGMVPNSGRLQSGHHVDRGDHKRHRICLRTRPPDPFPQVHDPTAPCPPREWRTDKPSCLEVYPTALHPRRRRSGRIRARISPHHAFHPLSRPKWTRDTKIGSEIITYN
jgi:hypothetical protein